MDKKRQRRIEAAKRFEKDFEPDVFEKILTYMNCTLRLIKSSTSSKTFIGRAFVWSESEEGHDFWSKIRASLPDE